MKKRIWIYMSCISLILLFVFTGCKTAQTSSVATPTLCTEFDIEGYLPVRVLIPRNNEKAYVVAFDTTKKEFEGNHAASSSAQLFVFEHTKNGFENPVPMKVPKGFKYGMCMALQPDGNELYFSAVNPDFFGNDSINIAHGTIEGTMLTNISPIDSINTTSDELMTAIDAHNNILYLASLNDRWDQIFYLANLGTPEQTSTLMSYHVNMSGSSSYGAALTPDGNTLINSAPYYYDAPLGAFSLIATPLKNSSPETSSLLDSNINAAGYQNMFPSISGDGSTMYYCHVPLKGSYSSDLLETCLYKINLKDLTSQMVSNTYETNPKYDTSNFDLKLRNKGDMATKKGVYYEIFVRAFADSDGDGTGDFNGITEKLDYLNDLGIDGLWLMPINASDTYHGYNVTDYNAVNPDYGTEADFKKLLDEAHKRDIKVIMDFVVNHTSSTHPWFQEALRNPNSPYKDYYRFVPSTNSKLYNENDTSAWGQPVWHEVGNSHFYGIFNESMPDLNFNNPSVRKDIEDAAHKWLNLGVDGFRLDAAIHLYGAHEFATLEDSDTHNIQWWNEFARSCEEVNPNVYLVGEAWEDDNAFERYVQPFDTKFNFTFQDQLVNALTSESALTKKGTSMSQNLEDLLKTYEGVDSNYIDGIFASNHDQTRIFSSVGSAEKAKLAANIYLTLPGNPYIYYGEEIGMTGLKNDGDDFLRDNFKWSNKEGSPNANWAHALWNWDLETTKTLTPLDEQMKNPDSMYSHYKEIIKLRKSTPALMDGSYSALKTSDKAILGYTRTKDSDVLYIYHNLSRNPVTMTLENTGAIYFNSNEQTKLNGTTLTLMPYSSIIISKS